MATPTRTEHITLVDGASELLCGSAAIDCYDWSELFRTGDSRGSNRNVPGAAGAVERPHVRGELFAELSFRCFGSRTDEGATIVEALHRSNVIQRIKDVRNFLDGATDRQLRIKLTTPDGSTTEDVTFRAMGSVTFPTPQIAEFRVLVSVPSGQFDIPAQTL